MKVLIYKTLNYSSQETAEIVDFFLFVVNNTLL